ncbi:hypothetical protein FACS1894113_2450 [Alphaproteobacteria bacterium]|nr:hypothetical protein FACS1894113_2450 [Alphaproteobacteria bacterium]
MFSFIITDYFALFSDSGVKIESPVGKRSKILLFPAVKALDTYNRALGRKLNYSEINNNFLAPISNLAAIVFQLLFIKPLFEEITAEELNTQTNDHPYTTFLRH